MKLRANDGVELELHSWLPSGNVKGVVQIVHGLAEHGARYAHVAAKLNDAGYAVYADDHRGHGKTASDADVGHFSDDDGWNKVLGDLAMVNRHAREKHPGVPVAVVGHSMGSFFGQHLMFAHPELLDAVVLSGSNGAIGILGTAGSMVAALERARMGKRGKSKLLDAMGFGAYNNKFKPARTAFDWLSRDPAVVDKYVADDRCGHLCTAQLWSDLFYGLATIADAKNVAKVPKQMPIYIFSGSLDPVSNATKGLTKLIDAYKAAGLNAEVRIYPEGRHEMMNETNKDEVIADLIKFLDRALSKPSAAAA
jgi:alpha-beta hydrolase superfamily lysophospholipase